MTWKICDKNLKLSDRFGQPTSLAMYTGNVNCFTATATQCSDGCNINNDIMCWYKTVLHLLGCFK